MEEPAGEHKAPNYYLVWFYLLILTIAEVGVAFVSHLPETILILALLFLAVWKAALVAMYYMHLRFEPPRLVMMVLAPLPLAVLITITILMEGL
ncbi:MAG TPA: cytochrome C oxidase subunit IV family protein [Gemmatimonadota bacterium]|nr:cytochrome C oxidase subunit IV family protein [Gemmatimonadota bacterium]